MSIINAEKPEAMNMKKYQVEITVVGSVVAKTVRERRRGPT